MLNCVICGAEVDTRDSCDPFPVRKEGRCCKICDDALVTPARMQLAGYPINPRTAGILKTLKDNPAATLKIEIMLADFASHLQKEAAEIGKGIERKLFKDFAEFKAEFQRLDSILARTENADEHIRTSVTMENYINWNTHLPLVKEAQRVMEHETIVEAIEFILAKETEQEEANDAENKN